jgi:rod shape-determining protein MreB and related proteins
MNFVTKLKPTIYIQISPEQITLRNLRTGVSITEIPELAVSQTDKLGLDVLLRQNVLAPNVLPRQNGSVFNVLPRQNKVLAIGQQARATAAAEHAVLINPFAHPRSLVSDFYAAETLIKHLLKSLLANSFFALSPRIVMHPLGSPEGGFTEVELRAFKEMALAAGASEVFVWTGHMLSDQELGSLC